jgi:hypothetical protein
MLGDVCVGEILCLECTFTAFLLHNYLTIFEIMQNLLLLLLVEKKTTFCLVIYKRKIKIN